MKTSRLVEVRVFLPRAIIKRIDRKKGIWGNTRSECIRFIVTTVLTKTPKENLT